MWVDLAGGVNVGLVGSIQELGVSIVGVGDHGDHPTEEVSPEEEDHRDAPPVEVPGYSFMVLHQTLQ